MRFIIDAHLPLYYKTKLVSEGHDATHTSELPGKNGTDDFEIIRISIDEQRVVITKDSDFRDAFLLRQEPYKLVLIKTGNLRLKEMKQLFDHHFELLINSLENASFIELYQQELFIIM